MKKLSFLTALFLSTSFLHASMFTAGIGIEKQEISGYVKKGNTINYFNNKSAETDGNANTGNLGLDDKNNPYVWLNIKLPLPVLPNIKLQYTKYHSTGHSNYVAGNVKLFNDVIIPAALTDAYTKLDINSYDITAYYNIPIPVIDLKLGVGADIWKGNTKIYDNQNKKMIVDEDFTVILPYVYGSIKTPEIKGFSAYGTVKWAKSGDNHHYDYLAGIKYTIDVAGPINPFISAGYRVKDVKGVDGDDETKIKYKGGFVEIGLDF